MKKTYSALPASMKNMEMYGFHWMEFVLSIPSPLYIVTSYKSNGLSNACMQSWTTFTSGKNGYFAIVSAVSKYGHLYQTLHETGEAVINFHVRRFVRPVYVHLPEQRLRHRRNRGGRPDGSPGRPGQRPDDPGVFMNLECRFKWEKEIAEGDDYVLACLEIVSAHIDERHLDESDLGRTGETGVLYNIHHPIHPEHFAGTATTIWAWCRKYGTMRNTEPPVDGVFGCCHCSSIAGLAGRACGIQRVAKAPRSRGNPFLPAYAGQKFLPPGIPPGDKIER